MGNEIRNAGKHIKRLEWVMFEDAERGRGISAGNGRHYFERNGAYFMTPVDDMKAQNEMLRMRLAETLNKASNDKALIEGMHKIIIRCCDKRLGGVKPDDVYKDFIKLKREVFGGPSDD